MSDRLNVELGDHIRHNLGEIYEIVEWTEDADNNFYLRELRRDGRLGSRRVTYYKTYLTSSNWQKLNTREERLLLSVGRFVKMLGAESLPDIHKLLIELEV